MLTRNIQDLETLIGGPLFVRDRKNVILSDVGRAYVQQASRALLYVERVVQAETRILSNIGESITKYAVMSVGPFDRTATPARSA